MTSMLRSCAGRFPAAFALAAAAWLGLSTAAGPSAAAAGLNPAAQAPLTAAQPVTDPASLVNPFLGTGLNVPAGPSSNNDFPGPDVPFGMMQWGPDTSPDRHPGGGYYYGDSRISGFSLTHLSGPGVGEFGDVPILPAVGALPASPSSATEPFSHADESASADYYSVQTGSPAVGTELTEAAHSAIGRFTFPATTQANLLLKLSGSQNGDSATSAEVVGDNEVQGSVTSSGNFGGRPNQYTVYFDITFDHPFTSYGTWTGSTITAGAREEAAKASGAAATTGPDGMYLRFDTTSNQVLQAKAGISFVSAANAKANWQAEQPGWSFDGVHAAGVAAWNKELSKIQIGGGPAGREQMFYTALYHALLHPNIFSDVNGQYMGFDNQVHTLAPGQTAQVANYSGWDIYRSQAQLEAIVDPAMASNSAQSMVNDASQDNGMLPKWSLANSETYTQIGDPADGILGGYYAFGARNFDTTAALKYALAEATKPGNIRPDLSYYEKLGYVPPDGVNTCCNWYGAASTTLEYAAADAALSHFAAALGDSGDAGMLLKRSQNWENLFNPATGYLQPRTTSGARVPVTPVTEANYVEGSASQYRWEVGWNLHGLFSAMGGSTTVNQQLDTFFTHLNDGNGSPYSEWSNEFDYAVPWAYDYTGEPYKTQQVVNQIRTQLYQDAPSNLGGNDDLGAGSSMGVMTMLGMFPEYTSTADMVLNSPEFPLEIIHLANGKAITINAPGASSASNYYVQALKLDGSPWQKPWLPGSAFTTGATLDYTVGSTPNPDWGAAPRNAPPSYGYGEMPAIGFTSSDQVTVPPGGTTTVNVGAQDVTGSAQRVQVSASAPSGISVSPSAGTIQVPQAAGHGYLQGTPGGTVTVHVPAGQADGDYPVSFRFTEAGQAIGTAVLSVDVDRPGDLAPFFNNVGVTDDSDPARGSFDNDGHSYSAQALANAGITPGSQITSDGIRFTWPGVPAGTPDNVAMTGQKIYWSGSGSTLGFLGAGVNGTHSGTGTIYYTDGTAQPFTITLTDSNTNNPAGGDALVATTSYLNSASPGRAHTPSLFAAFAPLNSGKTIQAIQLPQDEGDMHIFAVAAGP